MDEQSRGENVEATPGLTHFTVIADGVLARFVPGHSCQPGPAILGLKVWATSAQHAVRVAQQIGRHVGFTISGAAKIYKTAPAQPCGDKPCGYDLQLTPYDAEPGSADGPKPAQDGRGT